MTTTFRRDELFNCCTNLEEPNWSRFSNLELGGCIDVAGEREGSAIEGGISRTEAEFFTVYRRLNEGGCEAITDCASIEGAESVAAVLCRRSSLTLEIVC